MTSVANTAAMTTSAVHTLQPLIFYTLQTIVRWIPLFSLLTYLLTLHTTNRHRQSNLKFTMLLSLNYINETMYYWGVNSKMQTSHTLCSRPKRYGTLHLGLIRSQHVHRSSGNVGPWTRLPRNRRVRSIESAPRTPARDRGQTWRKKLTKRVFWLFLIFVR